MVNQRRIDVLRAIVSDYVSTGEPVGSRGLVERHNLGVSPATVRNDMAFLEEEGLIYQPHTSAGRVPTDKGYRLFVDQIARIKPLSLPERRAIAAFLAQAEDVDQVMDRTVRTLAGLTRQVAVVQYPTLRATSLRHVELVPMGTDRLLLVVISDSGAIEQHLIDVETPIDEHSLRVLRDVVNKRCAGLGQAQLRAALADLPEAVPADQVALTEAIVGGVEDSLDPKTEQRIVIAGTANLARKDLDFQHSIGPVLDALEEQVALLRLFSQMDRDRVNVSIGAENHHDGLAEASVVAGTYGADNGTLAHLGVVGPRRMDYPSTMAAVRAVAGYLSRFMAS